MDGWMDAWTDGWMDGCVAANLYYSWSRHQEARQPAAQQGVELQPVQFVDQLLGDDDGVQW